LILKVLKYTVLKRQCFLTIGIVGE
jgi:hypothetical protein